MSDYLDQILGIYAPDVPGVREALTAIVEAEVASRPNPWKDAVDDAAIVNWTLTSENANDPHKAINDLIRCIMRESLDPVVSKPAYDLVARAERAEADAATLREQVRAALQELDEFCHHDGCPAWQDGGPCECGFNKVYAALTPEGQTQ